MIEIIKDVSSILSEVTVIIAFLGLVLKPTRQKLKKWIQEIVAQDTAEKIDELSTKIDQQNAKIDAQDQKSSAADQQILDYIQDIDNKLIKVDKRVFENERDRIKAELSEYASRCARGLKIYPEEMVHIEEMYHKYKDEMHCNSSGSQNYQTIVNYYGHQEFLK